MFLVAAAIAGKRERFVKRLIIHVLCWIEEWLSIASYNVGKFSAWLEIERGWWRE
jgi:hypothetical protein